MRGPAGRDIPAARSLFGDARQCHRHICGAEALSCKVKPVAPWLPNLLRAASIKLS